MSPAPITDPSAGETRLAPTAAGSMTHERSSVTGQKAREPKRPEVTIPTIPPLQMQKTIRHGRLSAALSLT